MIEEREHHVHHAHQHAVATPPTKPAVAPISVPAKTRPANDARATAYASFDSAAL
jgi:hypothetical protein